MKVLVASKSDEQLGALLHSLEGSQPGSCGSVVVADNGLSQEFRDKWWQPTYVQLRGVGGPGRFVFARAINTVAIAAVPEDLLVLGDDTLMLTPNWRKQVNALFENWPERYGLLSLRLEGRGAGAVEDQKIPGASGWNWAGEFKVQPSRWTVCFVAALIPRKIWHLIGPMDERFLGYGHDDDDYCLRLWHAGYRVGMCDAATVWHGSGSYAKDYPGETWEALYDMNARIFGVKWGITTPGRKGLSCEDEHSGCVKKPWHRMP